MARLAVLQPPWGTVWDVRDSSISHPRTRSLDRNCLSFVPGMPLSFLVGMADPSTVRGLEWLCDRGVGGTPILRPERLAYVGLRDVDVYERKVLRRLQREHGLFASTMQDVDRLGIGRVMELGLQALGVTGDGDGTEAPLHLSFDIDSVDPQVISVRTCHP